MPWATTRSAADCAVSARPSPAETAPRLLSSVVASSMTDSETPGTTPHVHDEMVVDGGVEHTREEDNRLACEMLRAHHPQPGE